MKIVLFSDLHSHNFAPYSRQLPNGRNSRLQDSLNIIEQVENIAIEKKAGLVVFLGDLFHSRFKIEVDVLSSVAEYIQRLADVVNIVVLRGNHDTFDTVGDVHSLVFSGDRIWVVDKPRALGMDGVRLFALPWMESAEDVRNVLKEAEGDILLMHCGLAEGTVGPTDRKVDAHLSVGDLPLDRFKWVFLGDYHKHQELVPGRVMYCGSPLQLTFGERDETKYILVLDTDTGQVEKIETKAPRFFEFLSIKEFEDAVNTGKVVPDYDHVRVLYATEEAGAVEKLTKECEAVQFERQVKEVTQARCGSEILSHDFLLVAEHVRTIPDVKDQPLLCSYGLDVLEEVE